MWVAVNNNKVLKCIVSIPACNATRYESIKRERKKVLEINEIILFGLMAERLFFRPYWLWK